MTQIPLDPTGEAPRKVAQRDGRLFAVTGTDMGYTEVWGLGRIDGSPTSASLRELVAAHGSTEYLVSDTCFEVSKEYGPSLALYNLEVVRLLGTQRQH